MVPNHAGRVSRGDSRFALKFDQGEYRDIVRIEENQADPARPDHRNEYKEALDQWTDVGWRWARVMPMSGREFWHAQQAQSSVTHQINLRCAFAGLTATRHRLRIGSRIFNLEAVMNLDNRNQEQECRAQERELRPNETVA